MIQVPGAEEIGKTTRSFFDSMREHPVTLALVLTNVLLVAFLFYSGAAQLAQRQSTTETIITWQKATDQLMANCVSQEVTKMMLDNMQRITETMLATAGTDIKRMQEAIDRERERTRHLTDEYLKRIPPYSPQQEPPRLQRDISGQPIAGMPVHELFHIPP